MQQDFEGFLLSAKSHGENASVITVFSEELGKSRGLVKGGRKKKADLQPMCSLDVKWARRLEGQLGTMRIELLHQPSVTFFNDYGRLSCLHYLSEILDVALVDQEAHPHLFAATKEFLDKLSEANFWERLGFYELQLLQTMGYGLSLTKENAVPCEENTPLVWVSPKSGRAVSEAVGEPYKEKLFKLPYLFGGQKQENNDDFLDVFALTGHFLKQAVSQKGLQARKRLLDIGKETQFKD